MWLANELWRIVQAEDLHVSPLRQKENTYGTELTQTRYGSSVFSFMLLT
jgi:hypothetical protein